MRRGSRRQGLWAGLAALVVTGSLVAVGVAEATTVKASDEPHAAATPIATGLEVPWDVAFLPDGTALVTERISGRVLSIESGGEPTEVQVIEEAEDRGEGGLLGIAVSPDYATDGWVYVYYTTGSDNRIARFKLGETPEPILTGIPAGNIHNGGRIRFGPDGMLYATTGDAGNTDNAQDLDSLGGKILRMTPEGEPAEGNPFDGSLVWSYGHRNPQGIAWDADGRMYSSELGQNTWDEFNLIEPGNNYGWPIVEGDGDNPDFADPLLTWPTSEASPSGLAIRGDAAYMACLRGQRGYQIPLDGDGGVGAPEEILNGEYGRLRHFAVAPDDSLWVLTSNRDGRGTPGSDDDQIVRLDI